MATEKRPTLTVVYAAKALLQLDEIWEWNELRYGTAHADKYIKFLEGRIHSLSEQPLSGRPIGPRPNVRYILLRRRSSGHGHIAVYRLDQTRVNVLFVFHSAQDWKTKLSQELE